MEVNDTRFTEKAEAGEAILAVCKANQSLEPVTLGSYRGFKMELSFDSFQKEYQVLLKGEMTHRVPIGTSAAGNIQRLEDVYKRQIVQELIDYQLNDYPEDAIAQKQRELNVAYDRFTDCLLYTSRCV